MNPKPNEKAQRKQVWKATKAAVGAYARNPCRATEIRVEAALEEVKRTCAPCRPQGNGSGNAKGKG